MIIYVGFRKRLVFIRGRGRGGEGDAVLATRSNECTSRRFVSGGPKTYYIHIMAMPCAFCADDTRYYYYYSIALRIFVSFLRTKCKFYYNFPELCYTCVVHIYVHCIVAPRERRSPAAHEYNIISAYMCNIYIRAGCALYQCIV